MRNLSSFLIGLCFWLVLHPKLDILTVFIAGLIFIVQNAINIDFKPRRLIIFLIKLVYSFLLAILQSFKLITRGYFFNSKIQSTKVITDEELFEKTILITLTPYTLVIEDQHGHLIVHELVEEEKR